MNTPLQLEFCFPAMAQICRPIIDAIEAGSVNAEIKIVISSRPSAYGLVRAERAGIPTFSMTPKQYAEDKIEADKVIAQQLLDHGVKYVIMSGYMRMVHSPILNAFPNSVVNLHPALLPSFPGAHAIDEAYDSGVKITGCNSTFC